MTAKDSLLVQNGSWIEQLISPPKTLFQVAYHWGQTLLPRCLDGFPPVNLHGRGL